jgi:hypothetical protein
MRDVCECGWLVSRGRRGTAARKAEVGHGGSELLAGTESIQIIWAGQEVSLQDSALIRKTSGHERVNPVTVAGSTDPASRQ